MCLCVFCLRVSVILLCCMSRVCVFTCVHVVLGFVVNCVCVVCWFVFAPTRSYMISIYDHCIQSSLMTTMCDHHI